MPRTPLFTRGSLLFLLLLGAGLLWLVFTYQPQPKITGVKGGSLRPVMVEYIWFNEGSWSAPNGIYYANPRIPPAAGGVATLSSRYLPTQVRAGMTLYSNVFMRLCCWPRTWSKKPGPF